MIDDNWSNFEEQERMYSNQGKRQLRPTKQVTLPSFGYNFVLYDGMCSWLHTCYMLVYANYYEMICIYYDMWMLRGFDELSLVGLGA